MNEIVKVLLKDVVKHYLFWNIGTLIIVGIFVAYVLTGEDLVTKEIIEESLQEGKLSCVVFESGRLGITDTFYCMQEVGGLKFCYMKSDKGAGLETGASINCSIFKKARNTQRTEGKLSCVAFESGRFGAIDTSYCMQEVGESRFCYMKSDKGAALETGVNIDCSIFREAEKIQSKNG